MKTTTQNRTFFPVDPHASRDPRGGGALVTVVLMTLVMSLVLATLATSARHRVHTLQRQTVRTQALSIAEAGLHMAFRALAEDITLASDGGLVINNTAFAGGAFEVRAFSPSGTEDGVWLLQSTGLYRGQERVSVATVAWRSSGDEEERGGGSHLPGPFGPAALFAGGNLVLSGGTNVNTGEFGAHANGGVTLSGGPHFHTKFLSTNGGMTLNGNPQLVLDGGVGQMHADGPVILRGNVQGSMISSSSDITGNWGFTTNAQHVSPTVTYPNWFSPAPNVDQQSVDTVVSMQLPPLDVQAYRAFAQANNWHFQGNQQITRGWLTQLIRNRTGENVNNNRTDIRPEGGVFFVEGNVGLASDMEMVGMIIATGNITINGGSTVNNPTQFPALVSVNGNITIGGGARMTQPGWVYAMNGNVTGTGGASGLTGIVAGQNITLTGGYTLGEGMESSAFTWPGNEGGGGSNDDGGAGQLIVLSWIR